MTEDGRSLKIRMVQHRFEDIVAFASGGVYVSLANADGTFAAPILASAAFGTDNGWSSQDAYPCELADVRRAAPDAMSGFGRTGYCCCPRRPSNFAPNPDFHCSGSIG
jgi:hypothetical protein